MKINTNIAAFYPPGMLQPQGQPRPQQQDDGRQETLDAIKGARKLAPTLDEKAYETLRARFEQGEESRVVRDGMSKYARQALNAYGRVEQADDKDYASDVLGIDLYA